MCIFGISVDEGIQSLWYDRAVVGGSIRVHSAVFILQGLYVLKGTMKKILSLCGLHWFRIKVSLCIY